MDNKTEQDLIERLGRIERAIAEVRGLVGPFGVPFPNDEILVQSLHNTKYFIDANDLIMTPQLVVYRQWESDLSAFFIRSVSPDTVFVDVGANFGYFTCLAGSRIGTSGSGRVIAIEPNPRMFDLLTRNIRINWSMAPVETHGCAITPEGQSIDLIIPTNGAANASIKTEGVSQLIGGSCTVRHVRGDTVDRIVAGRRVDIIKIDVEGHELHVLDGATKTIGNAPDIHVVMEWSMSQIGEARIDPNAVVDRIESFGFAVYRLPESVHVTQAALAPLRLSRPDLLATPYANIYLRKCS